MRYLTQKNIIVGLLSCSPTGYILSEQPNIIYIFTDQQTATALSCSGNQDIKTPNIDRLANEGIRFVNAYCSSPLSSPSRAAMFTGYTPGQIGQLKNNVPLPDSIQGKTLGNIFADNGYTCGYAGKWHLPEGDIPEKGFGFEKLHGHNDFGLAEASIRFLQRKHTKPFFLVISFDNPHNICEYARGQELPFAKINEPDIKDCPQLPYNFAQNPYDADIIKSEKQLRYNLYPTIRYTPDDWRRYRNAYFRLVEHIDTEIGKILNAIDQNKLWNNTIVIFTSDHGDGNGAHGWNQKSALYEEVVNIPFIVRLPHKKNGGTTSEHLINNGVDLMPTLCEFAKINIPEHCLGTSWKNIVEKGYDTKARKFLVIETLFNQSTTQGWAVRTPDYKYILYDKGNNREQLFNMKTDRGELINLAVQKKYIDIIEKHRNILRKWMSINQIPQQRKDISVIPSR